MIGWSTALAVMLLAHPKPPVGNEDVGTAVVELTYARTPQRAAHQPIAATGHPQRIVAPLVVLDLSALTRSDPGYLVSMEDVAHWEEAHGHIPANAVILARSDTQTTWRTSSGDNKSTGNAARFPGFSEHAIQFLVEARYAYGLGTETPGGGRSVVLVYRGKS